MAQPAPLQINDMLTMLSAISIATERAVVSIKTLIPWLATEKAVADSSRPGEEEGRRLVILALSFIIAWLICQRAFSVPATEPHCLMLAFLSLGGSAFWSKVLGVLGAVRDARMSESDQRRLMLPNQAELANRGTSRLE